MIGDTHRLLRNLRKNHYVTRVGEDSTGRVCWHVYRPQGTHDDAGNYTRNDAYVGTVQSADGAGIESRLQEGAEISELYLEISTGAPYLRFGRRTYRRPQTEDSRNHLGVYFGRPTFLYNEALTDKDLQKELKGIVEGSRHAKFMEKRI